SSTTTASAAPSSAWPSIPTPCRLPWSSAPSRSSTWTSARSTTTSPASSCSAPTSRSWPRGMRCPCPGVPVGHLPLDGNAAESPSHLDNLKKLARLLPRGRLLYLSDTKLDTPANLLAIAAGGGQFLCGGAFSQQRKERFVRLRGKLRPVAYWPKSQEDR